MGVLMLIVHDETDERTFYLRIDQIAGLVGRRDHDLTEVLLVGCPLLTINIKVGDLFAAWSEAKRNPDQQVEIRCNPRIPEIPSAGADPFWPVDDD
jgi:hypothetical protein